MYWVFLNFQTVNRSEKFCTSTVTACFKNSKYFNMYKQLYKKQNIKTKYEPKKSRLRLI